MIYYIFINASNLITKYGLLTANLNELPVGAVAITQEQYFTIAGHASTCNYEDNEVICN
jgi:hypothetical protein